MPEQELAWPHAPVHRLNQSGTYFVTAATYLKVNHFKTRTRLDVLHRGLLRLASQFDWQLEAWAVFSNHYHFVAHSPRSSDTAESLSDMLSILHTKTSRWLNRIDGRKNRKVWHNFWETRLTYTKSYLARLNYVHQNAVHHRLVPVANQYPWCSAAWLERSAARSAVERIYRLKIDTVTVPDDFTPLDIR